MKREVILGLFLVVVLSGFVVAQSACNLDITMLNQDPYPAVPGDYVKAVFQARGVDNPNCGKITFELIEGFPFSLDPGVGNAITMRGGAYASDFATYLLAPYKIRVDEQALDEETPIKVRYASDKDVNQSYKVKEFNITIMDLHTDFEVAVKDYTKATNNLVFEILNVGEHDVEALTMEVPKQDNIAVKGSNRNIVGSLDSNEDTTFSFEAVPKSGEITLSIWYTDEINVRRVVEKKVVYDSSYFEDRVSDTNGGSKWTYVIVVLVIIGIIWWHRRARRKRLDREKRHRG